MRVGVLIDAVRLSGSRRAVLERLLHSDNAELALIIQAPAQSFSTRVWRVVDRVEQQLAKRVLHRALARARGIDVKTMSPGELGIDDPKLAGVPRLSVDERDAISAAKLDVIVDVRASNASQISPDLARLGIWRLACAEGAADRERPLGFWDFYRGAPLTDVMVLARTSIGEAEIARGCYSNMLWSWSLNDLLLGMRAAWLLDDALRKQVAHTTVQTAARCKRNVLQAPVALLKVVFRIVAEAIERAVSDDRWRILLASGDPLALRGAAPTIIEPPSHAYWADPFVVAKDGKHHIFFEEYPYATRRGVISHVCIDELTPGATLRDLASTVIIDQPHHLSYPFIFSHKGELFMIPESSGAELVEIWQATSFPHGWTRVATPLRGVAAADTSLLEHNGRWWLFTNIDRSGVGDHRGELHVFHAPDPIAGPWTPHAANPVVIDARCGRMAGGFFKTADSRPIRCGQVQGRKYGQEVSYRLITELTETTYAETPIENVAPIPVAPGARTHHVAARDGLIVVDECFVVPKWRRR